MLAEVEREQAKMVKEAKALVKKGNLKAAKMEAATIAKSKKHVEQQQVAMLQIREVRDTLRTDLAMIKAVKVIQKSTVITARMSELLRRAGVSETMRNLSMEMTKSGLISEMMDETFEDAFADEAVEEAAEIEVAKVLEEIVGPEIHAMKMPNGDPVIDPAVAAAATAAAAGAGAGEAKSTADPEMAALAKEAAAM